MRRICFAALAVIALSIGLEAKGTTVKLTLTGPGLAAPAVWVHAGIGPVLLLLAGGVLYTAGAVTYYRRSPDPVPAVFGFHEVFHAYVCAAAACQYVGISLLIH